MYSIWYTPQMTVKKNEHLSTKAETEWERRSYGIRDVIKVLKAEKKKNNLLSRADHGYWGAKW